MVGKDGLAAKNTSAANNYYYVSKESGMIGGHQDGNGGTVTADSKSNVIAHEALGSLDIYTQTKDKGKFSPFLHGHNDESRESIFHGQPFVKTEVGSNGTPHKAARILPADRDQLDNKFYTPTGRGGSSRGSLTNQTYKDNGGGKPTPVAAPKKE